MSISQFDDLSMSPLFVFSAKEKVFTFVHPKHGLVYKYIINFPQGWYSNSEICCSKDGWILNNFQVFFNPFTKELLRHRLGFREIRNTRCFGIIRGRRSWKELEEPQAPCNKYFNNFLVECDGNLLAVFEISLGKGVKVFELNESTMTWIKVESLENHMLFCWQNILFSCGKHSWNGK
ncbi:hypothetical protein MtrunA17_Chr2g0286391 [Medicago truncatula]|uniref:KIB1-4 beta-propeller domain-containing protein n=1 Tax=Medicago truncatula TaxID=3880 RepID=A0A396J6Y3_MEDTR|nr:hypothetical protein MtrunA17_Chr2g0286391 [Medicago truncatula]